jgi:lysozyme family protein
VTDIDALLDGVIAREGGYTDDPDDPGGPTIWGITEATARAYGYWGDMRAMTRATALEIYRTRYWQGPGFATIDSIDSALATKLFDVGVNQGTGAAVRFLQRALNVLNLNQSRWADLTVDGSFGRLTQHALTSFIAWRGDQGRRVLLNMVRALQTVAYIEDAENDPVEEKFEFGWCVRALL